MIKTDFIGKTSNFINISKLVESMELHNPVNCITDKEFLSVLLKFGTYLSLIKNKTVNPSILVLSLIENEKLRKLLMQYTCIDTLYGLLSKIFFFYPNLLKSKMLERKIKKIKQEKNIINF